MFVFVYGVLHLNHLQVGMQSELPDGVEVKVKLVLVDLLEVLLDVVKVLQSHSEVVLSLIRVAYLVFIPHALHVMDVQNLAFLAKLTHGSFSFGDVVNSDKVLRRLGVKVSVCLVKFPCLFVIVRG